MSAVTTSRSDRLRAARVLLFVGVFAAIPFHDAFPAEWIWQEDSRHPGQTAQVRRAFTLDEEVESGELCAVADFCRATVFLNGERLLDLEPYGQAQFTNVGRRVVSGENVLSISATAMDGPSAVALALELRLKGGKVLTISTDGWWEAAEASEATPVASFGAVESVFWSRPETDTAIHELDDYTQWKQALGADPTADPAAFLVPPGFELELLRSAGPEEGSWVSMEFDPQGRLIVAREDKGLLRLGLSAEAGGKIQVETINHDLLECRSLLWAHDSLYANANNSKGLYRLRDTNGDDRFDDVRLLYESTGGVGHGRNDLALGPDGNIYSIHGDDVDLPREAVDRTSPFREQRRGARTREGHLLRIGPDGSQPEVVCSGLRNPYGIAFRPDGELFTYDADAEFDMGAPWYRPTRVVQLVSGADFGWRGVTGSWPPYYPDHPDNGPPSLDIGKGSPTAVLFGTRSNFPAPYRDSLFILDWAYGRIVAVHMTPRGASYACRAEPFIKGRPLNVTDLAFGPDGAMYFVTGGRKTRSGLYRVRYVGSDVETPRSTAQQTARAAHAAEARALRHRLEALHVESDADALETAWPHLDSPDPWIRHAARIAVEHQPVAAWRERALAESRPFAAVTALLALARTPDEPPRPRILARLNELPLAELPSSMRLTAMHTYALCTAEPESLDPGLKNEVVAKLDPLFSDESWDLNRELSRLLVALGAEGAVPRIVELLSTAESQPERLHYLFVLRNARNGWTPELRRVYFLSLRQMRQFRGGDGMPKFIAQIEADALAVLSDGKRAELEPLLAEVEAQTAGPLPIEARPLVREWKLEDLVDAFSDVSSDRDLARGERLFSEALCIRCHRVGPRGEAIGPDLTSVASRFSRRDILKSILQPSLVVAEQYRRVQIVTTEGRVIVGQVIPSRDYRSATLQVATDPLRPESIVEIPKSEIETHAVSEASAMPDGLLNTLTRDEILDLIAWLEAGGRGLR